MRLHTLERLQKAISKRIWYLCDYINYNRTEKVKFLDKIEELRSEVKQGDKLLIIGNGPSIKNTDITKYKDYKIVTMNRAYIKWEHLGLHDIFFHVCINQLVISEFAEDLSNLRCPTFLNYTASKAGIVAMSKSLAIEYAKKNININCISPGFIKTAMTDKIDDKFKESIISKIPSARLGEPDDIANAVLFLTSNQSNYINGETLHVNGGMYMA